MKTLLHRCTKRHQTKNKTMDIYNDFNFLFSQVGYYISATDRSDWTALPENRNEVGLAMVWATYDNDTDGLYSITAYEDQLKFLASVNQEYHIRMYAAELWISGSATVSTQIYWYNNLLWICNLTNPAGLPAPEPSNEWTQVTSQNLVALDVAGAIKEKMDGYFSLVYSPATSNFRIVKTDDHTFTVEWIGEGTATDYIVYDYNLVELDSGTVSGDKIEILFGKDGLYVVSFKVDDILYYIEIPDFTDSEKCFLELMRTTLCECTSCDDCPGPLYQRALNFSNLYLLIRDFVYANTAVALGLIDATILRTEYVQALGIVMAKLFIMSDKCTCSENATSTTTTSESITVTTTE